MQVKAKYPLGCCKPKAQHKPAAKPKRALRPRELATKKSLVKAAAKPKRTPKLAEKKKSVNVSTQGNNNTIIVNVGS